MKIGELAGICAAIQSRGCYRCGHGMFMIVPHWEGPDHPKHDDELTDIRLELKCSYCTAADELRLEVNK